MAKQLADVVDAVPLAAVHTHHHSPSTARAAKPKEGPPLVRKFKKQECKTGNLISIDVKEVVVLLSGKVCKATRCKSKLTPKQVKRT